MTKYFIKFLFLISSVILISCNTKPKVNHLKTGIWQGEITMQQKKLPFNFEISKGDNNYKITLINGKEKLKMTNVKVVNDSLFFTFHIFDIAIKASFNNDKITGVYIKNYIKDYTLPFNASFNPKPPIQQSTDIFNGKWDMTFNSVNSDDNYKGIGIFKNENKQLTGTILTPTGDYRYLQGFTKNNKFTLYSFDGNHAFIFEATKQSDSTFTGDFWSGKSSHETFTATKNENATLPDANKLTFLKEGFHKINFKFPDLNGKMVSLTDKKYQNKVVILQIFGTWCPNCMDETNFYSAWYKKNKDKNVAIIGLAYEAKPDFKYAKNRVENMKKRLNVTYDFLIAGTYQNNGASKSLPMLNHVMSFPTSIIIDKKGIVRKIHTGFSGPATGKYYDDFKIEFNNFINQLLSEK
jgi:thiol-disulfide isomerase/thioredoxin